MRINIKFRVKKYIILAIPNTSLATRTSYVDKISLTISKYKLQVNIIVKLFKHVTRSVANSKFRKKSM